MEPENATLMDICSDGRMLASGYLPESVPGRYMELWLYDGYIYAIVQDATPGGNFKVHKIGLSNS